MHLLSVSVQWAWWCSFSAVWLGLSGHLQSIHPSTPRHIYSGPSLIKLWFVVSASVVELQPRVVHSSNADVCFCLCFNLVFLCPTTINYLSLFPTCRSALLVPNWSPICSASLKLPSALQLPYPHCQHYAKVEGAIFELKHYTLENFGALLGYFCISFLRDMWVLYIALFTLLDLSDIWSQNTPSHRDDVRA